jgi:hypothetical protein
MASRQIFANIQSFDSNHLTRAARRRNAQFQVFVCQVESLLSCMHPTPPWSRGVTSFTANHMSYQLNAVIQNQQSIGWRWRTESLKINDAVTFVHNFVALYVTRARLFMQH